MADKDINIERFAYDVCVSVLEKFGVFKPPDDMRKPNKYMGYDFLPRISRTVLVYAILIRDRFKTLAKVLCNRVEFKIENILNIFYEHLLKNKRVKSTVGTVKMCLSLAMCTEYIQFVATKDFAISLNKVVIGWNNFFEKNVRKDFEAEGGFSNTYSFLKSLPVDALDDLLKEFISDYLLPYGAKECSIEFINRCVALPGNPLDIILLGVKFLNASEVSTDISEQQCEIGDLKRSPCDDAGVKERKQEINDLHDTSSSSGSKVGCSEMPERCETSNSEILENKLPEISQNKDSSSTSTSEVNNSEMPQSEEREESNSEILRNTLLGIPPHEEMLRKIDSFFIENIPPPPKPQENEPVASKDLPLSSDQEELTEMIAGILSKLEHDMETLRNVLFKHGLLSLKSGRRGSGRGKDGKDKKPPKGPEGLI